MKDNKSHNFISAVVYCHNNAQLIDKFLNGLYKSLSDAFCNFEIIFVDDNSSDGSEQIIRDHFSDNKLTDGQESVTILKMSHFHGMERSMNAGVNLAIGDFVYEFDYMDIDYEWSVINQLYECSLSGYDIVRATPKKRMTLSSKIYYSLFNHYANMQYDLLSETFRILSRRAINRVHSITQDLPFRRAAYANCGLAMANITYNPTKEVKHNKNKGRMDLAVDSLILFTNITYKATIILTIVMLFITLSIGIYALTYKILRNPIEGWTTTSLFISIGFSGMFAIMTMIVKYLQILLNLQFKKKTYLFESINKLK